MGVARSLAWSYTSFLAFEFLDPLCGSGLYTAGFVLGTYQCAQSAHIFSTLSDVKDVWFIGDPVKGKQIAYASCHEAAGSSGNDVLYIPDFEIIQFKLLASQFRI
jgi:hypothetical protein